MFMHHRIDYFLFLISISISVFLFSEKTFGATQQRRLKVVVDPGHGGIDGGAYNGRQKESSLVLKIAQSVERKVQMDFSLAGQIDIVLTRTEDRHMDLAARIVPQLQSDVDLYLSLHLNSSPSPRAQGMEVYFDTGENFSGRASTQVFRKKISSHKTVNRIVLDLEESGRNKLSRIFAETLREQWTISPSKIRRVPFFVLNNNSAPSVLIEAAFLSNKNEAKLLENPEHIEAIAERIIKSLLTYKEIAYN